MDSDSLFKEIGYEKKEVKNHDGSIVAIIYEKKIYRKNINKFFNKVIMFSIIDEFVTLTNIQILSLEEIIAISKKVQELNWEEIWKTK